MSLEIGVELVQFVSNFRLLGLIISSDLTWKRHIQEATSKAKKLLGFLYRTFS